MSTSNIQTHQVIKSEPEDDEVSTQDDAAIRRLLNDDLGEYDFSKPSGDAQEKADDAIDYEDFSDDDLPDEEEAPTQSTNIATNNDDNANSDGMGDMFDGDGGQGQTSTEDIDMLFKGTEHEDDLFGEGDEMDLDDMMKTDEPIQPAALLPGPVQMANLSEEERNAIVKQYYPTFRKDKVLDYNLLLRERVEITPPVFPKAAKALIPAKFHLEIAVDDEKLFRSSTTKTPAVSEWTGIVSIEMRQEDEIILDSKLVELEEEDGEVHMIDEEKLQRDIEMACSSWDFDAPDVDQDWLVERSAKRLKLTPTRYIDMSTNVEFELEVASAERPKTILDLNDPHLLLEVRQPEENRKVRRIGGEFRRAKVNNTLTQRYNISNDEAYDLLKENHQSKVRSTIGQLNIEHTMPAIRLQTPYYRTRLNKADARIFHRPQLDFTPNVEIRFTKMKTLKKKHTRGKDVQAVFDNTKSLSLNDNSPFILMEYSEEHPFVLSNFGMGSRIINYYRRKTADDETRPKSELGELQTLMQHDRSPFWNFGSVEPGETVPTLYNKMIRAPIFKHDAKSTDFLVIRNTTSAGAYYYLRTIPHLFTVGQTFPVQDVPGPHSRKVTTASKNRLKMVCYRVIKRTGNGFLQVKDISEHFPENNDMQNRQKMKEFMSFSKEKKDDRGYWQMKPGETIPEEPAIRQMVSPETVCLLDAMQVGVRYLDDAGYGNSLLGGGDEDEEKDGMSVEEQLAPWIATRNFMNAIAGKAMLKLHGEGDPTGRGEGFSFVRTSMKGGFKAIGESVDEKLDAAKLKALGGHSYNVARQQQAYEEAIDRIWQAQKRSLSNPRDAELDDNNGDEMQDDSYHVGQTPASQAPTPATWRNNTGEDETASQFSRFSATGVKNKHVRIIRKKQLEDSTIVEEPPVILKDPKIIRMYLRRRQEIDKESIAYGDLAPTGNAHEDNRQKAMLIAEVTRLERNKERREARERQKARMNSAAGDVVSPATPGGAASGKPTTSRKCAHCGAVGHIKTNKKICPAYDSSGNLKPEYIKGYVKPEPASAGPSVAGTPI